jgi:hypothetical protein
MEREMADLADYMWLIAVAGGPLLLLILFAFAFYRRRNVTRAEFEAGERGARRIYEHRDTKDNREIRGQPPSSR